MCDTSHRHSNCFDQFRKASINTPSSSLLHEEDEENVPIETADVASDSADVSEVTVVGLREGEIGEEVAGEGEEETEPQLSCPLCRGHVKEWVVVEPARCFMNSKLRSCSCEACEFSGTYSDLRKHARLQHPGVRPTDADPERQRSWRRLERQRDIGDLISSFQSSFGGEERSNDDEILTFDEGGWLTVFFLIRVFRTDTGGSRSSSWSGTSRARSHIGVRRRSSRLWGESYEGETGTTSSRDEENDQSSDEQESGTRRRPVRRRRRAYINENEEEEEEEDDDNDEEEEVEEQ